MKRPLIASQSWLWLTFGRTIATLVLTGIPVDFLLFGATLVGVALFHRHTLHVALSGLVAITAFKLLWSPFHEGPGLDGFIVHLAHEWVVVGNLACLLLGFAILSRHFEKSHLPLTLPHILPDDWKGSFALLAIVFVLSSFLDNIAAALIGGAAARTLFKRVHVGYLAALVAAANAGGAGSVVGDTTTTMMWIDGVSPAQVLPAFIGAVAALLVFGFPASRQQQAFSPIFKDTRHQPVIDWTRVAIVAVMLVVAIGVNVTVNVAFPDAADRFPFIGVALWLVILVSTAVRRPDWEVLPEAGRGAVFLLSLVLSASMMPVEQLPAASWLNTLGLGLISSIFDNIPLTKLALEQGGYDWGILAYAVGVGGSMVWFGSSAGVALTGLYPEGRSVGRWVRDGWHVALGYVVGFFVMLSLAGWHPAPSHRPDGRPNPVAATAGNLP